MATEQHVMGNQHPVGEDGGGWFHRAGILSDTSVSTRGKTAPRAAQDFLSGIKRTGPET